MLLPTAWMTSAMEPRFGVGVGDGQRDALGIFRELDDDELAGLPDLRDARRVNVQPRDVRAKLLSGQNAMHCNLFYPAY